MSDFICPVCGADLLEKENGLACENNHSFDRARQGYVNLLLSQHGGRHGDDRLMTNARRDFLDTGLYKPFADAVVSLAADYLNGENGGTLCVDAGCGEGYYTDRLQREYPNCRFVGIDISKQTLIAAARRNKAISLAVGSIFSMPLSDKSAQLIVNLFSPFCGSEFSRVLADGGAVLHAFPLENHLMGLKRAVYDNPRPNEPADPNQTGFELIRSERISGTIQLDDARTISNLFMMTPYYYKTSQADQQKLSAIQQLSTEIDFFIGLYRPINK